MTCGGQVIQITMTLQKNEREAFMFKQILILGGCLFLPFVITAGENRPDKTGKSVAAASKDPDTEILELVEVVGKIPLSQSIQSITVVSEKEMENFNSDGLKSILNQCPGFLVLNGGNYGQIAYTYARGASVNQTLFLIDGIKIIDPSSSIGLNSTIFSPHLFEKVEIVRGPLSNLYGSNAMGGVVNLKTRDRRGMEISAFIGSHGTLEGNLYVSHNLGLFSFTLNGNWQKYSDGVVNDEFDNRGFYARADFQSKAIKTGLMFFGNFSDAGIPFNLGVSTPNRRYSQDNYLLVLPFSIQFRGPTKLDFKFSTNHNQYNFQDPDDSWTPFYSNRSTVTEGQLSLDTKPAEKLKLSLGIDYAAQKISDLEPSDIQLDGENTHSLSAFASAGLDIKSLLLSASFRIDKYKTQDPEFSPQLGFSWLISKTFKFRGSYSESFRAPTLPELLNPMWGNPGLKPEKGRSFEAGIDIYTRPVNFSLVYFDSAYENLIGYNPVTWTFANINQADISGIETSAGITLFDQVSVWVAYTFLHTHDFQNDQELLRRPKHSFSMMIAYKHSRFSVSGELIYVGRRLDYDELLWDTAESPAFDTFNANLTIPLNDKLILLAKATNAFNRQYQEILGYPAPGSRFMLGIKYKVW
jgi:vitamin B12 transporter